MGLVKMKEKQKRGESGRTGFSKTREAILGHRAKTRHWMRSHSKMFPEVDDQGGSGGPKPGELRNRAYLSWDQQRLRKRERPLAQQGTSQLASGKPQVQSFIVVSAENQS